MIQAHSPLGLAAHVRARSCEGQVILLDLRSNRYIGVGPTASAVLSQSVKGWPSVRSDIDDSDLAPNSQRPIDVGALTQRFLSEGLLDRSALQRPAEESLVMADASLDFEDLAMPIETGARHAARFLKAAALSALRLRYQSLEAIARGVSARRRRRQAGRESPSTASLVSMRTSAIVYERLRPFLVTSHRRCLFDSLTLLEFLAGEGLFPHWVIGVKTRPFGAHSWVQYESTVLNDQHAHVRQFLPILIA